jgi:SH3-like domain-containing protein
MRLPRSTFAFALVLAGAGVASAEDGTATESTKLFEDPGERSDVILKIKEGEKVDVLSKDGRWLRVRVRGRTGWVMRTAIEVEEEAVPRNTRRRPFVEGRSTGRGWTGGTEDDRVGGDAVDDDDDGGGGDDGGGDDDDGGDDRGRGRGGDDGGGDDDDGGDDDGGSTSRPRVKVMAKKVSLYTDREERDDVAATVRRGDVLFLEREDDGWYLVETADGDSGWLKASQVETTDDGGEDGPSRPGKRVIVGTAQLGVKLLGSRLTTAGGANAVPDNYVLGSSAATLSIGGELWYPYGKDYLLGGELSYAGSKAVPGLTYMGVNTGVTIHDLDLRAVAAYDLKKANGMMPMARLGYHYENFAIANVSNVMSNPAKIPSEIFRGPTLGAALEIPRLTPKIGLRVGLDALLFASKRVQTKNLEDGASPKSKAYWLGAGATYVWKNGMAFVGNYELTYSTTDFGAPLATSQRGHTGTGSARKDVNHGVTIGVNRLF